MSSDMTKLTDEQLDILRHSLGISNKHPTGYRNYYCDYMDAPLLVELVTLGMMTGPHTHSMLTDRLAYFHVTAAGKKEALRD